MIISIVGFSAGASANHYSPISFGVGAFNSAGNVLTSNDTPFRHNRTSNTTTTQPGTTTTQPGTTTTQPGTTTTQPATTTTQPAPTTTTQPGTTTTQPAPTTTLPAPTTTLPAPTTTTTVRATTTTVPPASTSYPVGLTSSSEPSGMSPPGAFSGFTQTYVNDFSGSSLPAGWYVYTGTPGGDAGAQWGANHVAVNNGLLQLNTFQDPAYNNTWVAGGLCQCGASQTYGAYFVRSRLTGAGPTGVELLWPVANVWPPEIDFNETGGATSGTSATVHYGASNSQIQRTTSIDMTKWHTWGVIWTSTSITYTVDGNVWGSVTNASSIPNQAMTLDLQQQTWCSSGWACPTAPQSMQVDWVAEYSVN